MRLRPAGPGTPRSLLVIGALLVAAAGCSDPPTRAQTDADLLVELHGTRRATVTLRANDVGGFLSPTVAPRGGPRTTTTSLTPLEQRRAFEALLRRPSRPRPDITTEIRDRQATFAAIGHELAPGTTVGDVRARPNRLVATLRFAQPITGTRRVRPAALAGALDRGGLPPQDTVWVAVCVPGTEGHWARTPDAFDRGRGCAGWVPDRAAATVGVLVSERTRSSTFWPIVGLAVAALALVGTSVLRIRRGRQGWNVPVTLAALGLAVVSTVALVHVHDAVGDLHHTFATHVDRADADRAHDLAPLGVILAIAGIGVLVWCWSDPERQRRRTSGDQAPNRSLRGSSV